jgi:hypothetical protein
VLGSLKRAAINGQAPLKSGTQHDKHYEEDDMIDMRKFGGEYYITVADVREGSLLMKIADAREGKFDKPDLIFETGDVLSLNATNRKTLMRAYGPTSDTWINKQVELVLGQVLFQGNPQEGVVVKPISPPLTAAEKTAVADLPKLSRPGGGAHDMDEAIPFAAELR